MDSYASISQELKKFFSSNKFFKVVLPLDVILFFGAIVYSLLQYVPLISELFIFSQPYARMIDYLGIISMLLVYANRKDQLLAIGFFLMAFEGGIGLLVSLFRHHYFASQRLVDLGIYLLIGLLVLKRSYKNDVTMEG